MGVGKLYDVASQAFDTYHQICENGVEVTDFSDNFCISDGFRADQFYNSRRSKISGEVGEDFW